MTEQTDDIYKWLKELCKTETAKFLKKNCNIHYNFVDVCWDSNDRETVIVSLDITMPLKKYKEQELYGQYIHDIEECISEYNQANGMYANSVEWRPVVLNNGNEQISSTTEIKAIVTEDYITRQIDLMNDSLKQNPHLSIGIAKELIETFSKWVLKNNNIPYDKDWDIPKLTKETNKIIFSISTGDSKAQQSVQKMISGATTMIQGITELRNTYGSGHGHEVEFKQLGVPYVRFIVAATSEIILLWKKLVDENQTIALPNNSAQNA